MPNLFAHIVLIGWVPAALLLFRTTRAVTATTIVFLGALVLLPASISVDFPGLPALDRDVIGALAGLIGYYLFVRPKLRHKQRLGWSAVLIATQVLCAFISIYTNPDSLRYGGTTLTGLSEYDALGAAFRRLFTIGVPFLLGYRLVRSHEDVQSVLRVIVFFGLAYVPLILWEVRMSPQLHSTLYGYSQREFLGQIRGTGFRPIVFTTSALEVALFMATAVIASVGLLQTGAKILGMSAILSLMFLLVGLVFCKSMGSLLFGLLAPALIIWTRAAVQGKVILLLSLVVLLYPLLRSQDLFPTRAAVAAAETVSHERAASLEFRFRNEDLLLNKARERLLFGWATYGRNRVYDDLTGNDVSVTDGYWIIELGMFGLTGFLSFFGLLLTPVILSARRLRFVPTAHQRASAAALILLVLVRAVDLIPNGFYAPFTMFLAGGLMQFANKTPSKSASQNEARTSRGRSDGGSIEPGHLPSIRGTSAS